MTPGAFRGFFQLVDFGECGGGFLLHRGAQVLEIRFAKLAGLVFEAEVAEVLVDHFLAFVKVGQAGFFLATFDAHGRENVEDQQQRKRDAAKKDDHRLRRIAGCGLRRGLEKHG